VIHPNEKVRMTLRALASSCTILCLTACASLPPHDPYGMEFKYLGCAGDWPEELPIEAIVTKESGARPSFFVRDPADCRLSVKDATYELEGDTLVLSYTVFADGPVAACYCEYDSRFTFEHLPAVEKVSFKHRF
jgi:hypothetical protein